MVLYTGLKHRTIYAAVVRSRDEVTKASTFHFYTHEEGHGLKSPSLHTFVNDTATSISGLNRVSNYKWLVKLRPRNSTEVFEICGWTN